MEKFGKFRNSYSYSYLNDSVTQLNGAIRPILGSVVVVIVVVVVDDDDDVYVDVNC